MATREFNADKRREARAAATIIIDGQAFRRRRMTGGRFREILENDEDLSEIKTAEEIDELGPSERRAYARASSLRNADSIYRQVAQLIEPVTPEAIGFAVDDEDALFDWLSQVDGGLDWDDAPPLLEWLDDLTAKRGNAAA